MNQLRRNILIGMGMMLVGCAGPSTQILPGEVVNSQPYELPEEHQVLEEGNPFYLQEALFFLSNMDKQVQAAGSEDVIAYIGQMFQDYGYKTTIEPILIEEEYVGGNVVGIRRAPAPDADILVITSSHNTGTNSPGANGVASGIATMLECSRLLSQLSTDTELRFVSFGGSKEQNLGSRSYVESLDIVEKQRVIGAIHLGSLGYVLDQEIVIGTMDGKQTLLGELLQQKSKELLGTPWEHTRRGMDQHSSFVIGQIPGLVVGQRWDAFELETPYDQPQIVNADQLMEVVDILSQTAAELMAVETPSQLAKSRFINPLQEQIYTQQKETPGLFGENYFQTTSTLGVEGIQTKSNVDGRGIQVDTYRYRMNWFDVDQIIYTDYHYFNGKLETISLDADGAGITLEEIISRLHTWYGDPINETTSPNGSELQWIDDLRGKGVTLTQKTDGYQVTLNAYERPSTWIGVYKMDGISEHQIPSTQREEILVDFVKTWISPTSYEWIEAIELYTDGLGQTKGYLSPFVSTSEEGEVTPRRLYLDLEDALDENGNLRNFTETVQLLLSLYGRILEESKAYGCASAYYERFASSSQVEMEAEADSMFTRDLKLFLLCQASEEPNTGDERMLFFYDYEKLFEMRIWIQNHLQLKQETVMEAEPPVEMRLPSQP